MITKLQIALNENILTTMTASVTSQRDYKFCPLYSCLREDGSGGNFLGQYLRDNGRHRSHGANCFRH